MQSVKPFKKLTLRNFFQHDVEKIKMAYRLSNSILKELSDIRASGNEVEIAVKDFFIRKFSPRYYVTDGHIVDQTLNVSSQYDVIISENAKNPVLFPLADGSESVFFETVHAVGEVKKSLYHNDLIAKFAENIHKTKSNLHRRTIDPHYFEGMNKGFLIDKKLTELPSQNQLFYFMFIVDGSNLNSKITDIFNSEKSSHLPNLTLLMNVGIILNVDSEHLENGRITVNLYPEHITRENKWILLNFENESDALAYFYMLLLKHLNANIVESPDLQMYTDELFHFTQHNISLL